MSETLPTVGGDDDIHLRWMREAMCMVHTSPIPWLSFRPNNDSGRRGNGSKGSPSRLRIYSR